MLLGAGAVDSPLACALNIMSILSISIMMHTRLFLLISMPNNGQSFQLLILNTCAHFARLDSSGYFQLSFHASISVFTTDREQCAECVLGPDDIRAQADLLRVAVGDEVVHTVSILSGVIVQADLLGAAQLKHWPNCSESVARIEIVTLRRKEK